MPSRMIYMVPNNRLTRADISDNSAVVLAIGSDAAASIWSIVRMALKLRIKNRPQDDRDLGLTITSVPTRRFESSIPARENQ